MEFFFNFLNKFHYFVINKENQNIMENQKSVPISLKAKFYFYQIDFDWDVLIG